MLYYYKKILELKLSKKSQIETQSLVFDNKNLQAITEFDSSVSENTKFQKLYTEIISYFEKEKPYQNPQFNNKQLAEILNSNTSYISIALNKIGKKSLISW